MMKRCVFYKYAVDIKYPERVEWIVCRDCRRLLQRGFLRDLLVNAILDYAKVESGDPRVTQLARVIEPGSDSDTRARIMTPNSIRIEALTRQAREERYAAWCKEHGQS